MSKKIIIIGLVLLVLLYLWYRNYQAKKAAATVVSSVPANPLSGYTSTPSVGHTLSDITSGEIVGTYNVAPPPITVINSAIITER